MKILYNTLAAAAVALCLQGCTDWNDHYDQNVGGGATATLWENIKAREDLTDFAEILQKTGYDKVLSAQQTYTIWAPVNSVLDSKMDSLRGVKDSLLVMEFVKNHIARNNYGASGAISEKVRMTNGKTMTFAGSGNAYVMNGVNVVNANLPSQNGVFYTIDNMLAFRPNLYEYLDKNESLTSLATLFHSFDKRELDVNQSVPGPVVNGEMTYLDSVFTNTNTLYDVIYANLGKEDSTFSMVLPTDQAWEAAQQKVKDCFKFAANYRGIYIKPDGKDSLTNVDIAADSLQKVYTNNALVENLVFNNNMYNNKQLLNQQSGFDSLVTTRFATLRGDDANGVFSGAKRVPLSNGYGFVTDQYNYPSWSTYCPALKTEAESGMVLATSINTASTAAQRVSSANQNPKVLGKVSNAFLELEPNGPTRAVEGYFYLPRVQSTRYVVYGVFVPANMIDTTAVVKPYKLRAQIFYNNARGAKATQNYTQTYTIDFKVGDRPTEEVSKVDTVCIGEINFPVAYTGDVYDRNVYPSIRIYNTASSTDLRNGKFDNTLRIDCFLLIPKELDDYIKAHPDYRWDD